MSGSPVADNSTAPRLDAAEADRLAKIYEIRKVPLPPAHLFTTEEYEDGLRQGEQFDAAFDAAVARITAPHWNSAVELLRGTSGHFALVQLRDRLASRLAELVGRLEQRGRDRHLAQLVSDVLATECERSGRESEIGTSLEARALSAPEDTWWWEPRRLSGAPPAFFVLRSPDIDSLVAAHKWTPSDLYCVQFERTCTWAEAIERARDSQPLFRRQQDRYNEQLRDFVEFRLNVVDQVLCEYELVGYVAEFGHGAVRSVRLNDDQAEFVRAALKGIRTVESQVRTKTRPKASWESVIKLIMNEKAWNRRKIERIATGLGAFVKRNNTTITTKPEIEPVNKRYELFRGKMSMYAELAGEAKLGKPPWAA